MIVYVTNQGSEIVKEGSHLKVQKDSSVQIIFTHKTTQLVLIGNVKISHLALVQLMRFSIDTVFLSFSGKYLGRLSLEEPKNIFLRKKQFLLADDRNFCLKVAKSIVIGKVSNLITILMRIQRTKKENVVKDKAKQIRNLLDGIEKAENVDSLRGYEGRASAIYFSALQYGFVEDFGFVHRVRRPPTDPVNSLLSLLYTFLMNRVYTAVRLAYLDPYLGVLHTLDYGRYSLILDLMEEFRPIIVDTLVMSLFNLRMLTKDSFEIEISTPMEEAENEGEECDLNDIIKDPIGKMNPYTLESDLISIPEQKVAEFDSENNNTYGKYPVKIKQEFLKKTIDAFEKKLSVSFFHPLAGKILTYGDAINFQAQLYRRVVEGEVEHYVPLLLR